MASFSIQRGGYAVTVDVSISGRDVEWTAVIMQSGIWFGGWNGNFHGPTNLNGAIEDALAAQIFILMGTLPE